MLRADLHIHTEYSFDTSMSLDSIISRCLKLGINCVAIADHGTIAGAVKMKEIAPFAVIVAEEILTPIGEIMGMFLTEEVPNGLTPEETIARIKAQEGLVCLPHPFDRFRGIGQRYKGIESVISEIDIIEVLNSRVVLNRYNRKAEFFAQKHGLLRSAGSDAHTLHEIGHAYVEMPEFDGREEFGAALAQGSVFGRRSCPLVHFASVWSRLRKLLRG
ncbi:PHP domain-containing protein [Chloroflexota bacterium]